MENSETIEYIGFRPYQYQRDVINEVIDAPNTGKKVVVKSPRQRGKTLMISNILLWYSINIRGTHNYYVSPTLKQCKEIYRAIVSAIYHSGIITRKNSTDFLIELNNGSTIAFKSAEQRDNLRGYTCNGILCIDEAAFIEDEIYYIIAPWVDYHKAVTLFTSTPWTKSGFFYRFYNMGMEGTDGVKTIDWTDSKYKEEMDTVMPPERLEEYRHIFPKNQFKTEYLGEWLDDEGSVFTDFIKCIKFNELKPTDKLVVGIDWSNQGGNDDTVMTIMTLEGKEVYVEAMNNLGPLNQMRHIVSFLGKIQNQIVEVVSEVNSLGKPYTATLKEKLPHLSIREFVTSNQSKGEIISNLQVAFEEGTIEILPDEKQNRQLSTYSAVYNPTTKVVTYNAPMGLKDDMVMALAFAWDGVRHKNKRGRYSISIV